MANREHSTAVKDSENQAHASEQPEANPPKYEEMSHEELFSRAEKIGIEGRSEMTREGLIEALRTR